MAFNRVAVAASAEKLVARGKIEGAIKEYRKLVADNPNDAMTLNRLGDLYVRTGKNEEAVKLFTQIAERYTEDGFFVKAIAIFKKIIKLDPTRLPVYERLAELYHKQGLVSEARTQYQVLVDYYLKHGKSDSAETVLEKMTALDSGDPTPHVKLAEIYHERGDHERELAQYRALAEMMIRHQRIDEATQVYARAIHSSPDDLGFITDAVLGLKDAGHVSAAAKLLAIAVEKNPQAEKIARIAGLGRAGRAEGSTATARRTEEEAGRVLKVSDVASAPPELRSRGPAAPPASDSSVATERPELHPEDLRAAEETTEELERTFSGRREAPAEADEPQLEEVLEFDLEIEGVDLEAPPPAATEATEVAPPEILEPIDWIFSPEPDLDLAPPPERAEAPAEAETAEAAVPIEVDGEEEVLFLETTEVELEEVEAELTTAAEDEAAAPAAAPQPVADEELEVTEVRQPPVEAPAARRLGDLLAEAEVFRKYGLAEKANDRVREILREEPRHVGALELAVYLALDAGRPERALPRAQELERLSTESEAAGETWRSVRGRLESAGFVFEHGRPTAAPAPKRVEKDSVSSLLDELAGLARPTRPAGPARREPPPTTPSADLSALVDGLRETTAPRRKAAQAPVEPPPLELESLLPPPEPPAEPPPLEEPEIEIPAIEAAAEPRAEIADEAIEDRLSWLDEAAARAAGKRSAPAAPSPGAEDLFDEEEGFFDLAAELEEELTHEEMVSGEELLPREEPSLEEIVEGFKKGVSESLSPEDYDTHFNLGIAYREMGLLDEAIGEFQLAAKHENYLLDCCSLLGGCFLEKGLPELAVKWYQRGLASPGLSEEGNLGLLYDLGTLYMTVGDDDNAKRTFVELYGINSNYRDVVPILEHLGSR